MKDRAWKKWSAKNSVRSLPDTNTIVRYLVGDDPALFAKARDFFDALIETVGGYT